MGTAAVCGHRLGNRPDRLTKGDNMKKTLVAVLLCGGSIVGVSAGSAFAGEITGNGDYKGVNDNASLCAYSGLQDDPFAPGSTQTPRDGAPGSPAFGDEKGRSCNPNGPVGD